MIHCVSWNRINVCDNFTHQCTAIESYHWPRLDRGDTVQRSLSAGANANTKMPRDPDCFNTISPFVGFWICGHAWELVEPACLAVAAGNAFAEWRQSWVLGLSVQKDWVLSVTGLKPFSSFWAWAIDIGFDRSITLVESFIVDTDKKGV